MHEFVCVCVCVRACAHVCVRSRVPKSTDETRLKTQLWSVAAFTHSSYVQSSSTCSSVKPSSVKRLQISVTEAFKVFTRT